MKERASTFGVKEEKEEEDEDEVDATLEAMLNAGDIPDADGAAEAEEEEEEKRPGAPTKKEEEEDKEQGEIKKDRNWSAVNCAFKESKLNFRGVLSPVAFTNWLWFRCIRPKLEETKSKLPDLPDDNNYGIEDVEEIFGEFMPASAKKDDKKDKK